MATLKQKITTISEALDTLEKAITFFNKSEKSQNNEEIFLAARDSLIQRFKYCTDLFWKVLTLYLEELEKVQIPAYSPRGVIGKTVKVKTITETEGQECMQMVESRNRTSHIYHKEIAAEIAQHIPAFYKLMKKIVDKIEKKAR